MTQAREQEQRPGENPRRAKAFSVTSAPAVCASIPRPPRVYRRHTSNEGGGEDRSRSLSGSGCSTPRWTGALEEQTDEAYIINTAEGSVSNWHENAVVETLPEPEDTVMLDSPRVAKQLLALSLNHHTLSPYTRQTGQVVTRTTPYEVKREVQPPRRKVVGRVSLAKGAVRVEMGGNGGGGSHSSSASSSRGC